MNKKQYVVIGLGRFGTAVAKTLYELDNDVLAIDSDEQRIQEVSEYVTHAIHTNATDEESLKSLGISNFDVAIICIGVNMEDSIMVTLLVKELGVKYVIAKANTSVHAKILYKIGADKVVFPERDMGIRVVQDMVSSSILDYIELSSEYGIAEIIPNEGWNNKTLEQLDLRSRYGINIVAIKRKDNIDVAPSPEYRILRGDIIVAIGTYKHLNKLDVING
mgnify:FL=1